MIEERIRKLQRQILDLEANIIHNRMYTSYTMNQNNYNPSYDILKKLREELSYYMNEYANMKLNEYSTPYDILDRIDMNIIEQYVRRKKIRQINKIK
jgi:hypothetical protein